MKKILIVGCLGIMFYSLKAQEISSLALTSEDNNETIDTTNFIKNDTSNDIASDTSQKVLGDVPDVKKNGDTTHIRLGKKGITIIEKNGKTIVNIENQDNEENKNNEEIEQEEDDFAHKKNKKSYSTERKNFESHWGGVELFFNNFMNDKYSLNLTPSDQFIELNWSKSIGVRLNLIEYSIAFSRFQGLTTGLGFEFNSYYFSSDSNNIMKQNGKIVPKIKPAGASDYSKNKLKDTYLNIPLFYEIQFPLGNERRPLYFAAGVIGGLKLGSRTKEYYKLNGDSKKEVIKNDFYMSPIRLGYQVRLGYRKIHLFATYYNTPLFISGKGPDVNPFDIGLMLINW